MYIDTKLRIVNRNYFNDHFETVPIEIRVPESSASMENLGDSGSVRVVQPNTWWDRNKETVGTIAEGAGIALAGTAIIIGAVALAPESLGTSLAAGLASGSRLILMGFQTLKPAMG